jgi:excisionase family DNA binding protein
MLPKRSKRQISSEDLAAALTALVLLPDQVTLLQARVHQLEEEVRRLQLGDPEQRLDTEQAAALLGMTTGALRAAAARGIAPAIRLGRRLRFRRGDLLAWGTDPAMRRKRRRR